MLILSALKPHSKSSRPQESTGRKRVHEQSFAHRSSPTATITTTTTRPTTKTKTTGEFISTFAFLEANLQICKHGDQVWMQIVASKVPRSFERLVYRRASLSMGRQPRRRQPIEHCVHCVQESETIRSSIRQPDGQCISGLRLSSVGNKFISERPTLRMVSSMSDSKVLVQLMIILDYVTLRK